MKGGGGREEEVRRAEKRWITTEKGQQRKSRKNASCRTMKQIRMPKKKKRIRE